MERFNEKKKTTFSIQKIGTHNKGPEIKGRSNEKKKTRRFSVNFVFDSQLQ